MAHESDPALLVLHALRLRGRVELDALSAAMGRSAVEVQDMLDPASRDGLVVHHEGRVAGWSLTSDGRDRQVTLLHADRAAAACDDAVNAAYERFLSLNDDFLATCTRWQLRDEQTVNDHTDRRYDADVIGELHDIDAAVQPTCSDLAAALARMSIYSPRLTTALGRIDGGELQWFTSPAVDSYHTVWFELHEDLLQTLGIERGAGR